MINKLGNNTVDSLISALTSIESIISPTIQILTPSKAILENDLLSVNKSKINSPIAIGHVFSKSVSQTSQKFHSINNAFLFYDGQIPFSIQQKKIMKKESSDKLKKYHTTLARDLILNGEGAFLFGIAEKNQLILGRDPLGIQPFYYGENETSIVFASNRRILWKLKIGNPVFFPPGQISIASQSGQKFKHIKNFTCSSTVALSLEDAAKILFHILDNSIVSHVKGLSKCAIAFSGGLDSSLIAFLTKKYVKNLQLIHVSLENKPEIEEAKKAAKILDLPIKIYQYSESDIKKIASKVLWLIEESDPIKVSIGIPFYWIAEKTKQDDFDVLLAGQGADELFGGYKRYLDAYLSKDGETVRNQLFADISYMHESNFARDMKIFNFHGVDLRCPFASYKLVEFALKLPVNLKMERNPYSLRKLVLRQVGRDLGLPLSIVEKPKRALQYSTGVINALKKIAKKEEKTLSEYIDSIFQNQRT
jgi:asparagine synthase (glutamine-hydrolysing)